MSQIVKTKRQANFKDFNRFGAFKGLVEQKKVVFNSFVCKLGFFRTRDPTRAKKNPIYTRTHQINYYFICT
jgi:predicted NUDIX family phosphoesterase